LGKETGLDVTQRVILARRIMKNTALADSYLASLEFPDMREGVLAAELEEAEEDLQLRAGVSF
jgi:hypothetical protein